MAKLARCESGGVAWPTTTPAGPVKRTRASPNRRLTVSHLVSAGPDTNLLILRNRSPHDDRDVVGSAAVEGVLQQLLAGLTRAGHRRQAVGDLLVGHVLRQSVAAKQVNVVPIGLEPRHDRHGLLTADR